MPEPTKIDTDTAEATAESLARLTVDSLRRSTLQAAKQYYTLAQRYSPSAESRTEINAYVGLVMASSYAYMLAAALLVMREDMDLDAAADAAMNLEDILVNGDDGDTNADVMPGVTNPAIMNGVDDPDRRIAADLVYRRYLDRLGPEWLRESDPEHCAAELLAWHRERDQSPERAARIEALARSGVLTITFPADPPLRDLRNRVAELEKELETLRAHNRAAAVDPRPVPGEACAEAVRSAAGLPLDYCDPDPLRALRSVFHVLGKQIDTQAVPVVMPPENPEDEPETELVVRVAKLTPIMQALAKQRRAAAATQSGCDRHGPDERCVGCATEEEILAAIPPHGVAL